MIVEVYSDDTVTLKGNPQIDLLLDEGAYLLCEIEGDTWEDCMQKHYDMKGWGRYKPFSEEKI